MRKFMFVYVFVFVCISVQITAQSQQVCFSNSLVNIARDPSPEGITMGDFNEDGKLDLAVANFEAPLSIHLGNGNGTFSSPVFYNVSSGRPKSICSSDFNNDGNLDIGVSTSAGTVGILLGAGDGTFGGETTFLVGARPQSITIADFNSDGNIDITVVNYDDNNASILIGNGDGTFDAAVNYTMGTNPFSLTQGDFDNDGKIDLAVTNSQSNNIYLLIGNGNGTFNTTPIILGTFLYPTAIAKSDFNNDSNLDIAFANGTDEVFILLGQGNGSFLAPIKSSVISPSCIAVADYNGDNNVDLAVGRANGASSENLTVFLGKGDGTISTTMNYSTGNNYASSIATGDVNNDNKMDIAIVHGRSPDISISLNQTAPTANAGLDKTVYYGYAPNQCATLTGSATGGTAPYQYSWSNGATTQNTSVCPTATTTYTLTITDASGCSSTDTVLVNVMDVRCGKNNKSVLVCHRGNTLCVPLPQVKGHLGHGDYLGTCTASRISLNMDSSIVEDEKPLALYPNPNTGLFTVEVCKNNIAEEAKIEVVNSVGQLVYSKAPFKIEGCIKETIELKSDLPEGLYFLNLIIGEKMETRKLILTK